jgi:WD40-like Beta Propeller Repeat
MTSRRHAFSGQSIRLAVSAVLLLTACADESPDHATGGIEVLVQAGGAGEDRDGITVIFDEQTRIGLNGAGSVLFADVEPGPHRITIAGVDGGCTVSGGDRQTAVVTGGDTAHVAFELTCEAARGGIDVVTATAGQDFDPDGYLLQLDGVEALVLNNAGIHRVSAPEGPHTLSLSGLSANCTLDDPEPRLVVVTGGQPATASFAVSCAAVERAGRGHEIAFSSDRGGTDSGSVAVYVMNDDGNGVRRLVDTLALQHASPAWSADGSSIAFVGTTPNLAPAITIATADGSNVRQLRMQQPLFSNDPLSWAPDGSGILFPGMGDDFCPLLFQSATDGSGDHPVSTPDLCSFAEFVDLASYSPDGDRIVIVTEHDSFTLGIVNGIAIIDLASGEEVPRPCFLFQTPHVAWSPDGTRLAVTAQSEVGFEVQLWIEDLAQRTCTQITTGVGSNGSATWSPDGTRIAFVSTRDGNPEIYVMNADGSDQRRLTRNTGVDRQPAWRP